MGFFSYRGRNARGELIEGRLEAADSAAVADQLFSTGITPVDIRAVAPAVAAPEVGEWVQRMFRPRVTLVDLMLYSRQMHTLLRSGVPIMRALSGLEDAATNPSFKAVIADLRASLDSGRELSAAMQRHPEVFSAYYVSLVKVGEMTGELETVFLRLYEHLAFEKDIRERIHSALRYPIFVLGAMLVAIVLINVLIIPAFAKLFQGFNAPLPFMTRLLIGASDFSIAYGPLLLLVLVGAVLAFRAWRATPAGRYVWARTILRLPVAGKIITKATLARFARSFALAVKSGIPVVQGLSTVAVVVDNEFMGRQIHEMRESVERGESVLRAALSTRVFTPVVLQMIAVGDETGELDELMQEIAEMYEREVDYEVKTLAAQTEPILIVSLGVLVLILAMGVFLPIWDLSKVVFRR
jgi:MSHA biogenesis protein MshG